MEIDTFIKWKFTSTCQDRRTRISGKLKKLQELVPNMDKQTSYTDMLDFAVQYIKGLKNEVQLLDGNSNSRRNLYKFEEDTPYAEVEVMKMCMPLLSPASGLIQFEMSEGQAMQAGELIARLDLDDPSAERKTEPFHGSFPVLGPPTVFSGKVHHRCAASLNAAWMILSGYNPNIDEVVQNFLSCLDCHELPFLQWQEC